MIAKDYTTSIPKWAHSAKLIERKIGLWEQTAGFVLQRIFSAPPRLCGFPFGYGLQLRCDSRLQRPIGFYGVDCRNTFVNRSHCRILQMGFALIPIAAGEIIVGPVISVAVFNGVLHVFIKGHWIVRMPAVADVSSPDALLAPNVRSSVVEMGKRSGSCDPAEIPGSAEIVFGTGPNDNRFAFIVDENHIVPFTGPVIL